MKLNQLILLLGVDAVRHRNKKYSDDETFTYKTETQVQNVAELSGIEEYITMIEDEIKAARKADKILKDKPKKKGRKKHNVSFKYIISGNGQHKLD
ncbi:Oidioi.mRNA.OKI2018_I69.chr2.g7019.t1.cds [Oikopleura dioica]|uniref:Oidioi.mRNA.OKI2018_I69.chr2.g7019.t1.cds n=1 Tax=Oikopleura dioica TaxID=34765 RepID=A0ABN7TAX8_OIKDI|nr:Oidioi.mRNA.OKI2018_I69.chr2.g7019.t1.cds [Oikopleura dioica]